VGLQGDSFDEITDGLAEGQQVVVPRQTGTTGGTNGFPFFPGPGAGGGFGGGGGGFGGGGNGGGNRRGGGG
jgi:hypothetical protein